jgi:hypothetical protein
VSNRQSGLYEFIGQRLRVIYRFGPSNKSLTRASWSDKGQPDVVWFEFERIIDDNQGFVPLFNGKDMTGWKTVGEPRWSWVDGRLRGSAARGNNVGYLITEADYEDFELELEYRLPVGANSGLFLRAVVDTAVFGTGQMEVQLIDDEGFPGQTPIQTTGSLYRVFERKAVPAIRRGDWNAVRVRLRQRHLEVWINGTQTVDANLDTAAATDKARVPGLTRRAGGIGLQRAQGPEIEFRNARIRKLAVPADQGFVPLFNGKDLTGWKTHPDARAKWAVESGYLTASGPVGHLFTERSDYENFIFRIEARINDGGNGGQYFRAAFGPGFPRGYEAQINATHRDPIKTGSLYPGFDAAMTQGQRDRLIIKEAPHKANEWFTQEVTAVGNHMTIKVNGKTTVDYVDATNAYRKGHLVLQHHDVGSRLEVRKVEVKELPR